MWWAVIASTRSRGQGAHGWHEAAQSHPQAVISLVGHHTRAGKQSLQTKNNALSREYQCQSTTVCQDRKSTRLNSSHQIISYAVFCLKKKKTIWTPRADSPPARKNPHQ